MRQVCLYAPLGGVPGTCYLQGRTQTHSRQGPSLDGSTGTHKYLPVVVLPRNSDLLHKVHAQPFQCLGSSLPAITESQALGLGEDQVKAFREAKEALTLSTVLTHYNPDLEVVLECDAPPYGVRAVLSHCLEDGSIRPIAFSSQSLTSAERRYVQLDKEGLAIVFGVKKYRPQTPAAHFQ